ncbi:transcription antitermination factor NusB [Tenacibaculum finnmarkense]|uniref:N utilization substance protein B homolog n=1 Tax=Tenacibaculum finnmarkense genomovar ulcerans TaxID=2781388 RepID=A0A2I2LDF7_9FLAO|nr:transcription antitermination factor NusB [Tenacibaculum finnmarkense]ALU74537.1 antitermination protein NusB [Tenacibaculum dicentrarchi]MBE7634435.1 transcription antitermination factor NusB [Tenacibaculum finnmarkense genomovar ulcerans]MBE7645596.1 transcription antitermination factor NusB [Tenacibaculum finnmarkense genomovar ulcerans]MBE7647577.1 transcription antitermination factor NusB [Tenacibaculum finnmarkense genomovar ulcerans]MBE7687642.1 transcription antitermination factor N
MINRRHIRVKVMQSVYAMQQSHSDDILKEEKFLKDSIDKMYDLYVLNLQLLIQVQKLANKRIALSKKKILATKEELNPNTKFIDNRVINKLNESSSLSAYVELHELNYWELDSEYVRIILDELLNSELYKNYANTTGDSYHIDSAFVVSFFKEIIAPNEKLADYFEDKMISWVDDIPFVNTWIVKSLNKQKEQNPFILGSLYKDSEDKQFVSKLFQKTALNQHTYEDDIIEKTPNWEADRIADIDMIIIKMSITEFLHFPSIPSSVSINEYIEVAKDYSTNKSSYFINGVLDKLSKDYLASNKMVKIGRGLL